MPQVRTKPEKKQAKNQQDQITLDSNFAKTDQLASIVESNTMENHHDYLPSYNAQIYYIFLFISK